MSLKDWSLRDVEDLLDEFFQMVEMGDAEGPDSWQSVKYEESVPCTVPDLGTLNVVESYGGEGQGDDYWVVIMLTDDETSRYFKKSGWYQSYSGGELDGELQEVAPVPKVVTVWE